MIDHNRKLKEESKRAGHSTKPSMPRMLAAPTTSYVPKASALAHASANQTCDIGKAVEAKVSTSLKRTFSQMTQAINNLQKGKGKGKGKTEAKGKSKGKAKKGNAKKGKGKGKGSKAEKGTEQQEKAANTKDPKAKDKLRT